MNKTEAKQVLSMLLGAFPRHGLDESGIRMWADALSRMDEESARRAAQTIVQTHEFMPTIARFNEQVRKYVDAAKIGEPRPDCTNPDGCQGWWLDEIEVPIIAKATGETVDTRTKLVARPCSDCRPDLHDRWSRGQLSGTIS